MLTNNLNRGQTLATQQEEDSDENQIKDNKMYMDEFDDILEDGQSLQLHPCGMNGMSNTFQSFEQKRSMKNQNPIAREESEMAVNKSLITVSNSG